MVVSQSLHIHNKINMLVNLVVLSSLLLPVKTDWVEISQQHYRKPFRPIQAKGKVQVTTETVNIFGGKNNRIYANQSVNQDWDENGDPQEASSIGSVKHVRRPGVNVRRTGRPTGNVIKHVPQPINEIDEQNEKIIDFYDFDVRHDDSHFAYEIPGKDQIANKRRPINEHNLNDRFENIDKYRHRVDSERHGNKVVRLKENPKPTEVPRRTNRFEEGKVRKNEAHKLNNVRSTTLAPRNISKIKDITSNNNKRMDMKNPEEEVNFNNQNQFKSAGHISGGNRRRIYFFDPPKTDVHEDKYIVQSGSMKNPKESINERDKPIASTDTSKPHADTEKGMTVSTPKPNRNKKPLDFTIAYKPESAELFSPSATKAVKILEETPATESYDQQHKNIKTHKSDSLNEDSILIDSPLIQTADDKNPFVTNHYHNINHGNIRRIDFFGNKKAEEDIVEFNENLNKSPESSNNVNKNRKPDNLISGTINKGNGEPVNLKDKFVFIDDKITQSQKQVHIKQPFITGTIQRVQFPENNHGGKQYLTSNTGVKYPDDQELPMEHKQSNNNGDRTSEHLSRFASDRPPLVQNSADDGDDDDSDIQSTPIRRLDISSLTLANIPAFITKQEPPDAHEIYNVFIETESTTQKIYTRRLTTVAVKVEESTPNWVDGEVKPSTDKITENPADENSKDEKVKKPNPLENVAKFMKVVSETITKNTQRSIKGKVRYLEQLRDSILTNIEEHIDSVWPDDASAAASRPRGARGARAARGHVDFPSSEGALMTISFLTFAVFLIKLVLQVIHTYKNKTMMVTPAVFAVSRMAGAMGRPHDNSNN